MQGYKFHVYGVRVQREHPTRCAGVVMTVIAGHHEQHREVATRSVNSLKSARSMLNVAGSGPDVWTGLSDAGGRGR